MSNSLDRETLSRVSDFALYDPIRQILLELSVLLEEPTESRCKGTLLYSVMALSKFCIALCIFEHVMAHT